MQVCSGPPQFLERSVLALLAESWSAVGLQRQATPQSLPGRLTCLGLKRSAYVFNAGFSEQTEGHETSWFLPEKKFSP